MKVNHNHANLIEAMEYTPEKWEFTGVREVNTARKCSCGHDIIYNFPMRHKETGKIIPIGSVCIESAPFLPVELVAQYKEIIKRWKAERKAAELLRQETIKGEIKANYEKNYEMLKDFYKNRYELGQRFPKNDSYIFYSQLYWLQKNCFKLNNKKLKTAKGWIKNYTNIINEMKEFNAKWQIFEVLYG